MDEKQKNFLDAQGRSLEDAFFLKENARLMEQRRTLEKMKETKENLAKVSGIRNDAVLAKLVELDIRPDLVATLAAIPLVEVAWADGEMDEKESAALLALAEKAGLTGKGISTDTLSLWLKQRPDPKLLEAWSHYIQGLCEQLSGPEKASLRDDLMANAKAVAEAAGGVLGFGRISRKEQDMLDQLTRAFL